MLRQHATTITKIRKQNESFFVSEIRSASLGDRPVRPDRPEQWSSKNCSSRKTHLIKLIGCYLLLDGLRCFLLCSPGGPHFFRRMLAHYSVCRKDSVRAGFLFTWSRPHSHTKLQNRWRGQKEAEQIPAAMGIPSLTLRRERVKERGGERRKGKCLSQSSLCLIYAMIGQDFATSSL